MRLMKEAIVQQKIASIFISYPMGYKAELVIRFDDAFEHTTSCRKCRSIHTEIDEGKQLCSVGYNQEISVRSLCGFRQKQ